MLPIKKKMRALVVGLGRSGTSVTKLLSKKGVHVTITDERNKTDLKDYLDQLEGCDYDSELGKHVLKTFTEQDFIVVSPGVPLDIKPLQQAAKSGIPIVSEIEVAAQFIQEPIIAVTGTNGKTTTSHLIAEMIRAGGKTAFLGGNVGTPLSEYVLQREKCDFVVCEVSSFQLESCHDFKPHMAVFLNIAPDHLDRHGTFENYLAAKLRLKNKMTEEDYIITNVRDSKLMSALSGVGAKMMYFTTDALSKVPVHYQEKFQGGYYENAALQLVSQRWKEHSFRFKELFFEGFTIEKINLLPLSARAWGFFGSILILLRCL